MPYKFQTTKKKIGKKNDRRRKLTDAQRTEIKDLYGKISQRKLARMFGVSRRLIIFIGCPDKYTANIKARLKRGGSKIYYDKDDNTKYMKKHRHYKKALFDKGLMEQGKTKDVVRQRECPICQNIFKTTQGNRVYCYKCSPTSV